MGGRGGSAVSNTDRACNEYQPSIPRFFWPGPPRAKPVTKYQNQQVIFAQGDPADAVFYIEAGKVKVTVLSHQGKEAVLALLGAGDFFGEGCMTEQTHRMTSAVAMEECTIARLEKAVVRPAKTDRVLCKLHRRNVQLCTEYVQFCTVGFC